MENHENQENHGKNASHQNFSILYLLAAITGVLTAWILTGSVLWMTIGVILGLLTAGFFINVLIKGSEEA